MTPILFALLVGIILGAAGLLVFAWLDLYFQKRKASRDIAQAIRDAEDGMKKDLNLRG